MGKRLPPGEAERRAAERKRAFWAGETYKKYNPTIEGYGSPEDWAAAAEAFNGGTSLKATSIDADLELLGLGEVPADKRAVQNAWKKAAMALFQKHGSSDTAPGYKDDFEELMAASGRILKRIR